jgi:hypothetical protein
VVYLFASTTVNPRKVKLDQTIEVWVRLRRLEALERLLIAAVIVFSCVIFNVGLRDRLSAWKLRDTAVAFTECLRSMEEYARQQNEFVDFEIVPATPERRCACFVKSSKKVVLTQEFPDEVFARGVLTLDPQGVPAHATRILFVCGKMHQIVQVDEKGSVSIP